MHLDCDSKTLIYNMKRLAVRKPFFLNYFGLVIYIEFKYKIA